MEVEKLLKDLERQRLHVLYSVEVGEVGPAVGSWRYRLLLLLLLLLLLRIFLERYSHRLLRIPLEL